MAAGLIAVLLGTESLLTAFWVARLVPALSIYPWSVTVVVACRALVAAVQFSASLMLRRRHAAGRLFARTALLASALLLAIELGARVAPSNLFPSYRWPVIVGYAVYALLATWLLRTPPRPTSGR
jgi:hypothetical protein